MIISNIKIKNHTQSIIKLLLIITCLLTSSCNMRPSIYQQNNICALFHSYPSWYKYAKQSKKRWGTPVWAQMAVIHQESRFSAQAKATNKIFIGIPIPFTHKSTAYGYAQALDGSWQNYKVYTKQPNAARDEFKYATDFVAWYLYRARKYLHLANNQMADLYYAYHEGINGYKKENHLKRDGLDLAARKVAKQASIYKNQLENCYL